VIPVTNPATGEILGTVPRLGGAKTRCASASKYRNTGQTGVCTNRFLVQDGAWEGLNLGELYLDGAQTSVKIPAGILAPGNSYYFLLSAFEDSQYDPTVAPWAALRFPYGRSQTASGIVTP
jgi:hypothetical protein